jgi:hypothetical protein
LVTSGATETKELATSVDNVEAESNARDSKDSKEPIRRGAFRLPEFFFVPPERRRCIHTIALPPRMTGI